MAQSFDRSVGSVVPKTGGAPTSTTPRGLLHRVTGVRVMCPCYRVYASQRLRPKKLRIFEGEGVDSTGIKCRDRKSIDFPKYCDARLKSSKSGKRDEEQARSSANANSSRIFSPPNPCEDGCLALAQSFDCSVTMKKKTEVGVYS